MPAGGVNPGELLTDALLREITKGDRITAVTPGATLGRAAAPASAYRSAPVFFHARTTETRGTRTHPVAGPEGDQGHGMVSGAASTRCDRLPVYWPTVKASSSPSSNSPTSPVTTIARGPGARGHQLAPLALGFARAAGSAQRAGPAAVLVEGRKPHDKLRHLADMCRCRSAHESVRLPPRASPPSVESAVGQCPPAPAAPPVPPVRRRRAPPTSSARHRSGRPGRCRRRRRSR